MKIYHHDSPAAMLETAKDLPESNDGHGGYGPATGSMSERDDKKWTFGELKTFEATAEHILAGKAPPAVRALIPDYRDRIATQMQDCGELGFTKRRQMVWSDAGDEIDADRLNQQHERPWRSVRIGRARPLIRLGISLVISAGNNAERFAELGATVCAAADVLTMLGFGVEIVGLWGVNRHQSHNRPYCHRFILKSAGEPLDIERIGSTACPGFSRSVCFRLCELHEGRHWSGPVTLDWNAYKDELELDYVIARNYDRAILQGLQGITMSEGWSHA